MLLLAVASLLLTFVLSTKTSNLQRLVRANSSPAPIAIAARGNASS
ncbi:hypothetical protein [Chroococcidiopsis sp. CCNUC1]|nr:hypothetical protein [Chroococcidiopsis sp. CCNUC1]URD52299.1 hypothetical protein M5J74_09955 [Chroococcidiopsis sp. CCNUC1]